MVTISISEPTRVEDLKWGGLIGKYKVIGEHYECSYFIDYAFGGFVAGQTAEGARSRAIEMANKYIEQVDKGRIE